MTRVASRVQGTWRLLLVVGIAIVFPRTLWGQASMDNQEGPGHVRTEGASQVPVVEVRRTEVETIYLGPVLSLLERSKSYHELQVRIDQVDYLQEIAFDMREEIRLAMPPSLLIPPAPGEDRRLPPPSEALRTVIQRVDEVAYQLIACVFSANQASRLRQLAIQHEGEVSLLRDNLRKRIGLSDVEFQSLHPLVMELRSLEETQATQAVTNRKAELRKSIVQRLTSSQKEEWDKLRGRLVGELLP